jgi:hypothetical protein
VSLKIDGTEHRVTMNRKNPAAVKLATTMRNLDAQQYAAIVRYLGAVTRTFSALNTRWSPEFFLKNIFRDMQEGAVILQKYGEKRFVRDVIFRDWKNAIRASSKGSDEWANWRREFEEAGGKIYFSNMSDVGRLQKHIDLNLRSKSGPRAALKNSSS